MKRSRFETGEIVSRSYYESREYTLSIWIELDTSMRFGTLDWTKLQILTAALEQIGRSLLIAGHKGEIVAQHRGKSERIPFSSMPAIEAAIARIVSLVQDTPLASDVPSRISQKNVSKTAPEMSLWAPHILRISQNPDSKIAFFSTQKLDHSLQSELIYQHIDFHEFIIEHPEEYYQNESLSGRILRTLRTLKSPEVPNLGQSFAPYGSSTVINHPTLLVI
jgi:hypothetical protein